VGHGEVTLVVTDDGPGLSPSQLERIFAPFEAVDPSDPREKGSTGLALAIAKSVVEQHGGRIWAESEPGAGARFLVVLPLLEGGRAA
jgi:two-component system, OmpR family, sensor histidine kinase VicK